MIDASFIINIAPFAVPAAASIIGAGVISVVEKILPSDKK